MKLIRLWVLVVLVSVMMGCVPAAADNVTESSTEQFGELLYSDWVYTFRRAVDDEAGVVCYSLVTPKATAMDCMLVSDTKLER